MVSAMTMHRGARHVDREAITKVEPPEANGRWNPVPFEMLLTQVEGEMKKREMLVRKSSQALSHDNNRMFAIMDLHPLGQEIAEDINNAGQNISLGLRSSYDKSFSARLGLGSRVWICDNLAFTADIVFSRKNTTHIIDELPQMVSDAFDQLPGLIYSQEQMQAHWKNTNITDKDAHDAMIRIIKAKKPNGKPMGILPPSQMPKVIKYYEEPEYNGGLDEDKTVWTLFNAYTSHYKNAFRKTPASAADRSMKLTKMFQNIWNPRKTSNGLQRDNDKGAIQPSMA